MNKTTELVIFNEGIGGDEPYTEQEYRQWKREHYGGALTRFIDRWFRPINHRMRSLRELRRAVR